jgi:multidrug efflux pump subunit AcrB
MNLSAPFIHRPVATSLIAVAIAVIGIAAYPFLPISPLPTIDFPTIQVSASYPGASPDVMASAVATPLEKQLGIIPGVTQITSSSTLGSTSITVQFDLTRTVDSVAPDVQAAISAASGQLPQNLPSPPSYRKVNPADPPILVLGVQSDVCRLRRSMTTPKTCWRSRYRSFPGSGRCRSAASSSPRCGFRSIPQNSA